MKKYLFLSVFALVLLLSGSVFANEFVGGFLYTTLNLEGFNEVMNDANGGFYVVDRAGEAVDDLINNIFDAKLNSPSPQCFYLESEYNSEKEYAGDLNKAMGFYLGFSTPVPSEDYEMDVIGQYEHFTTGSEGSLDFDLTISGGLYGRPDAMTACYLPEITITGANSNNLDLTVHGLAVYLAPRVNEYLTLKGGIGYYLGSGTATFSRNLDLNIDEYQYEYDAYSASTQCIGSYIDDLVDDEDIFELDLAGSIGFNLGASLQYPLEENLDFVAGLSYRHLKMKVTAVELEDEEEGIETECGGFDLDPLLDDVLAIPEEVDFPEEEDFSGFALTLGFSHDF